MNYKEALEKKKEIGDFIQHKEMKMKVYISPEDENDFIEFIDDYRVMKFDDESCLKYSKNKLFKLVGLWTDGANVLHKNL